VSVFGLIKKHRTVLQWMILALLFCSDCALLIAWSLSLNPVSGTERSVYMDTSAGVLTLEFVVAIVHLISSYLTVVAFLVVLYFWVLVVHNELFPNRSSVNVNRVLQLF
jgi:hypothetical protein